MIRRPLPAGDDVDTAEQRTVLLRQSRAARPPHRHENLPGAASVQEWSVVACRLGKSCDTRLVMSIRRSGLAGVRREETRKCKDALHLPLAAAGRGSATAGRAG